MPLAKLKSVTSLNNPRGFEVTKSLIHIKVTKVQYYTGTITFLPIRPPDFFITMIFWVKGLLIWCIIIMYRGPLLKTTIEVIYST